MDRRSTLRTTRQLTDKGKEAFETEVRSFSGKLRVEQRYIDIIVLDIKEQTVVEENLAKQFIEEIRKHFMAFKDISCQFYNFLCAQRTMEADRELSAHKVIALATEEKVFQVLEHLQEVIQSDYDVSTTEKKVTLKEDPPPIPQKETEQKSQKSGSTSSSSLFVKQKMKLEAAKVRAKYAQEEAELIKSQASIQANLKILAVKREVEEAEGELRALSEVCSDVDSLHSSQMDNVKEKRTAEFILQQGENNNKCVQGNLNVNAPEFYPNPSRTFTEPSQTDVCRQLTQFMMKKDLLLSRLCKYDDSPGYFLAWKASFQNVMHELDVTPAEEVDLLVKWLGPESSKQALSIRAANAANPELGVSRIWSRLDDRFGSPEMVEGALRKKLNNFHRISNKDNKRLFELVDIVSEIEAIKENPTYKTLLSVYDSSAGVNQIMSKLPFYIQEKWTVEATRYKTEHNTAYPPFQIFSKFLQRIAKMKNDPSFFYEDSTVSKDASSKPLQQTRGQARPVHLSVARTEATDVKSEDNKAVNKEKRANPNVCPFHGTNHLLNECRSFRTKTLAERREFLKKNGLCFRCCGQIKHLRRDCKELIRCTVCESHEHPTALHVDKEENSRAYGKYEGEKHNTEIDSKCTQVCGKASVVSKSCSKILLVKVYPDERPDQARKLYALIDDQSNRSLATSNFFHIFGEDGPDNEYILSSCAGKFTTSGRFASNYTVESLDGSCILKLPTLIECNDIPNNRHEIPFPRIASR